MVKAAETEERSEAREVRSDDAFYCGGRETHNFIPHRRSARREVKAAENSSLRSSLPLAVLVVEIAKLNLRATSVTSFLALVASFLVTPCLLSLT